MKVLQINCVYKTGSTGKITCDIHRALQDRGIESVVCYGRGEKIKEPHVYKCCGELYSHLNKALSFISGVLYGGCFFSTNRLIRIIKKEKPDVVHLQCINGYFVNVYRLLRWLKKHKVSTVLTLHAEFMFTGGCGHALDCNQWELDTGCCGAKCPRLKEEKWALVDRVGTMWKRMKMAVEGFGDRLTVTSVSPWLMDRAKRSRILSGFDHRVVLNGLETSVFHSYQTDDLRKLHGLSTEKIIFYVTPTFSLDPTHIKGGHFVVELAKQLSGKDIKILVAGSYEQGIEVPDNIVLLGRISDQTTLAKYYSMADLTLLTSKRETFSMIVAESLCCGTPVVGFKAGGPETIAIPNYCFFSESGSIAGLKKSIEECLQIKKDKGIESESRNVYSKERMVDDYLRIYERSLLR